MFPPVFTFTLKHCLKTTQVFTVPATKFINCKARIPLKRNNLLCQILDVPSLCVTSDGCRCCLCPCQNFSVSCCMSRVPQEVRDICLHSDGWWIRCTEATSRVYRCTCSGKLLPLILPPSFCGGSISPWWLCPTGTRFVLQKEWLMWARCWARHRRAKTKPASSFPQRCRSRRRATSSAPMHEVGQGSRSWTASPPR